MKHLIFAAAIFSLSIHALADTSEAPKHDKWADLAVKIAPISLEDYEAKYPLFLEAAALTKDDQMMPSAPGCTATTIQEAEKLPKEEQAKCIQTGGFGGHSIVFVRGACLQPNAPTQQLYNCSQDASVMADPYAGVGISTNADFWNVAWIGIPGYKLFYAADVGPDEELTYDRYKQVLAEVDGLHLYDTIELTPRNAAKKYRPDGFTDHQFLIMDAFGTDFGSTLRGNVYWTRAPITNAQLDAVIAELNARNLDFYNRRATDHLDWDMILDNCAHTVTNVFAAAGLVRPKSTVNLGDEDKFKHPGPITKWLEATKVILTGNLAIPADTIVHIARETSKPEFTSLRSTYFWRKLRKRVIARQPMVGPGVIVGAHLMHANNDEFAYGGEAVMLSLPDFIPSPIFADNRRRDKIYSGTRTTVLDANRQYYIDMIQKLLDKAKVEIQGSYDDAPSGALIKFYENDYRPYLEGELARLQTN